MVSFSTLRNTIQGPKFCLSNTNMFRFSRHMHTRRGNESSIYLLPNSNSVFMTVGLLKAPLPSLHAYNTYLDVRSNLFSRQFSNGSNMNSDNKTPTSSTESESTKNVPALSPQTSPLPRAPGTLPSVSLLPSLSEVPGLVLSLSKTIITKLLEWSVIAGKWALRSTYVLLTNPSQARANTMAVWALVKEEVHHYYLGMKLLIAETKTSSKLVRKAARGDGLSRRERLQLKRTISDLLRLVPFAFVVLIPFAELALPLLLKLFPNMLPSQFEKADSRQEAYKRSLNSRLEMHGILQEIVSERIAARSGQPSGGASATPLQDLMDQLEAVRAGEPLPAETVVSLSTLFHDDLTLDNLPHGQLAALAKYCGFSPYGPDSLLRMQLVSRFKFIRDDDRDLLLEGTTNLTLQELKSACEARGMVAYGLSEAQYRDQLDEWLDLAVVKRVPITIMMLSRAFQLASGKPGKAAKGKAAKGKAKSKGETDEETVAVLQQTISSLDPRVVTEAVLEAGEASEALVDKALDKEDKKAILEMRLESIEFQNELIEEETEEKEKEKELLMLGKEKDKEKIEAPSTPAQLPHSTPAHSHTHSITSTPASTSATATTSPTPAATSTAASGKDSVSTQASTAASQVTPTTMAAPTVSTTAPATSAGASVEVTPAEPATTAVEAPISVEEEEEKEQDVLESVASKISFARERRLLDKLKTIQMQLDAAPTSGPDWNRIVQHVTPRHSTSIPADALHQIQPANTAEDAAKVTPEEAAVKSSEAEALEDKGEKKRQERQDKLTQYLHSRLSQMTEQLEKELNTVRFATVLTSVDTDADGQVSQAEIVQALKGLLEGVQTEEAAAALIKRLDSDADGVVTVKALEEFLDSVVREMDYEAEQDFDDIGNPEVLKKKKEKEEKEKKEKEKEKEKKAEKK